MKIVLGSDGSVELIRSEHVTRGQSNSRHVLIEWVEGASPIDTGQVMADNMVVELCITRPDGEQSGWLTAVKVEGEIKYRYVLSAWDTAVPGEASLQVRWYDATQLVEPEKEDENEPETFDVSNEAFFIVDNGKIAQPFFIHEQDYKDFVLNFVLPLQQAFKKYDVNKIPGNIKYETDGFKTTPAIYYNFEHEVVDIIVEPQEGKEAIITEKKNIHRGSLLVDMSGDKQTELFFAENKRLYVRTISASEIGTFEDVFSEWSKIDTPQQRDIDALKATIINKINYADIEDNLVESKREDLDEIDPNSKRVLSARQGFLLKALIDAIEGFIKTIHIQNGKDDGSLVSRFFKKYESGGVELFNSVEGVGSNGFGIGININGKCVNAQGYKITIEGDYNNADGNEIDIYGKCNKVNGSHIKIGTKTTPSHYHNVRGQNHIVVGEGNNLEGNGITIQNSNCKYSTLSGNNIIVNGSFQKSTVIGCDISINLSGTGIVINGKGIKFNDYTYMHDGLTILGQYNYCFQANNSSERDKYKDIILIVGGGSGEEDRRNNLEMFKDGTIKVFDKKTGEMVEHGCGNVSIIIDDFLSENSLNPVQNKIITKKLQELEQELKKVNPNIIVDDTLLEDSLNPVQNKVVTAAFKSKLSKLVHSEERNYLYGQDKNGQTFTPLCREGEILTGAVPKYGVDGFIPVGETPVSPRAAVPRSYIDALILTGGAKMMKVDSSKIQFLPAAGRFDIVRTNELFDKKSMVTNFKASIQKPQKIITNVFNQLANSVIDQIDLYDLPGVGNDKTYLYVTLAESGTELYATLQELISKPFSTPSLRCYFGDSEDAIGVAIKINWSISNSNYNSSSGSYTIYIKLDSLIDIGDVIQAKYSLEIPELQGATRPTYPEGNNILECSLAGVYNYNSDLTLTNVSNNYVQLEGSANTSDVEPTYRQYLLTIGRTKSLVNNLTYTQKVYEKLREQLNFNFVLDDFTERIIYCMSATSDGPVIFTIQIFDDYFGINCSDESVFTNGEELAEISLYYQIYY